MVPTPRHTFADLPGRLGAAVVLALTVPSLLASGVESRAQSTRIDAAGAPRAAEQPSSPDPPPASAEPTPLDDAPEPFDPGATSDEVAADRAEALALFAAGRAREHRGDTAAALRLYQRAARRDPEAAAILRAIVPLAVRLQRPAEAVRYAMLAAEHGPADPLVLRRLGVYLAEQGRWNEAAAMAERAVAARRGAPPSAADVLLLMELGRLRHLVGQEAEAAEALATVVAALEEPERSDLDEPTRRLLLAEPAATYQLFGECFLQAGKTDDALRAFEKAAELEPNEGLRQLQRARVFARSGRLPEAADALDRCLEAGLNADAETPLDSLSEVFDKLGRPNDVAAFLEQLHEKTPENRPLALALARECLRAARLDRAESLYRGYLGKQATPEAWQGLITVLIEKNRPDELLAALGAVAAETGGFDVLGQTWRRLTAEASWADRLLAAADALRQTAPERLGAGPRLAAAYLAIEAKRFDDVERWIDAPSGAIDRRLLARLYLAWGVGLLLADRPGDAAHAFRRAIDEKPLGEDNPLFHDYLALALAQNGRIDEALAAARRAVELQPDIPRYHGRAAWVLYRGQRREEALAAYRALVERFDAQHRSEETRDVLRRARLALSNLCVELGRPEEAEEWLEQVLDEFPGDVSALNDLGYLWVERGAHLGRAVRMIEQAVAAEPDNAAYRDSLGWAYHRLGRHGEAVAELEKAAAGRADAVILDHLGDAYNAVGRREEAAGAWRRAAEVYRREGRAAEAEKIERKAAGQTSCNGAAGRRANTASPGRAARDVGAPKRDGIVASAS